MEQIVGIYKDISQFIVGTLVEETDEKIVLKRALLVSVEREKNGNGVVPNFFPVTLLTLDPPFHIMGFLKEKSIDFETTYWKKNMINPNILELEEQVKTIYSQNFAGILPSSSVPAHPTAPQPSAEDNIIKLF